MSYRQAPGPRLEALEANTMMSAGASISPAKIAGGEDRRGLPRPASSDRASDLAHFRARTIALGGRIQGSFASRQGVTYTGTRFHISATGAISPIGSAVVVGTFMTPGLRAGVATGTLTLIGPEGSLHLDLRGRRPFAARSPGIAADPIDTGSIGTGPPIISDPVFLVIPFGYEITGGTGKYAHDRGTGNVHIEIDVGLIPAPAGTPAFNPVSIPTESGTADVVFDPARFGSSRIRDIG